MNCGKSSEKRKHSTEQLHLSESDIFSSFKGIVLDHEGSVQCHFPKSPPQEPILRYFYPAHKYTFNFFIKLQHYVSVTLVVSVRKAFELEFCVHSLLYTSMIYVPIDVIIIKIFVITTTNFTFFRASCSCCLSYVEILPSQTHSIYNPFPCN
jgi:hypothetical protein